MWDADIVQVFECLRGFPEGKPKIDMERKAQRHDMGIMFAEFQGRGIFRQGV